MEAPSPTLSPPQRGRGNGGYDANGNLISKTFKASGNHTDYTYDAENRLIRVDEFAFGATTPGATSTYRYDGLGRRIEKVGNGVTRRYVYDGEDILLEYDETNTLQARYTHGPGIDEPVAMQRGGSNFFYHQDGLGTVTDLTDGSGTTAQSYAYDAYGNILQQTGTVENPYTYTGREYDSETGLYYYRARYYDPRTGRFLQKDRMGLESPEAPFTLYSYVASNPTNLTDPSGLITYKSGVPPASPALASLLGCMESCYGQPLVITSTTDSHPGDNPHSRGEAADIRYPSDPKKLLCCSAQCGAGYAKDEKIHPSSKSTAPHIHVQTGAGTGGGAGDLPTSPPCGCNTP